MAIERMAAWYMACLAAHSRFDGSNVDLLHRHHASKARLAASPPLAIASIRTRGVICQLMPHLSLHQPHWLSCPPLRMIAFQ